MEKYGTKWTHDETVIAMGLYFQMPFGRIHQTAPEIIKIAGLMGRNPASLAMKMCNIARLDPSLETKGVSGLKNGARMEEQVWCEYEGHRDELALKYNELVHRLKGGDLVDKSCDQVIKTPPGLDGERLSRYRINQSFFRRSVISAYNGACCITGIDDDRLLVASHIKPWAHCETGEERTCTENGLCLNPLHDCAFDKGLITLDEDLRVKNSPSLRDALTRMLYNEYFAKYEGVKIRPPGRGRPSESFLEYHRRKIYVDK